MLTVVDDCTASAQQQSYSSCQHNIYKRHYTPKGGAEEKHLLDAQKERPLSVLVKTIWKTNYWHTETPKATHMPLEYTAALQDIFWFSITGTVLNSSKFQGSEKIQESPGYKAQLLST